MIAANSDAPFFAPQPSMSNQMLRAQASAYTASPALGAADRPPLPGTTSIVFCALS
jgi:hypothetical protein